MLRHILLLSAAGLAFLGTLLQAPLGAITVYYKLNPWLVGTHFLLSIVVLTLGVLVALDRSPEAEKAFARAV
jgi:heme A synthase